MKKPNHDFTLIGVNQGASVVYAWLSIGVHPRSSAAK
jgi:hypothetical protein